MTLGYVNFNPFLIEAPKSFSRIIFEQTNKWTPFKPFTYFYTYVKPSAFAKGSNNSIKFIENHNLLIEDFLCTFRLLLTTRWSQCLPDWTFFKKVLVKNFNESIQNSPKVTFRLFWNMSLFKTALATYKPTLGKIGHFLFHQLVTLKP